MYILIPHQVQTSGVRPKVMAEQEGEIRKFGLIKGVYVPTLLTIVGVIMYLRLGWVVGMVGLLGAWIIILLAFTITTATALSMASILSNMRIGPGGVYSIISRSLGLEIGGSIGVPLYFSLTFSVVLYIFGFREGVHFLLPNLSSVIIDLFVFALIAGIVFFSTDLAFRVQYGILALILASLVSIFAAGLGAGPSFVFQEPPAGESFWFVFAVFFPAATGIMAGANMSGELTDPRRSITFGTLGAIGTALAIYLAVSYWLAANVPSGELVNNYLSLADYSLMGRVVILGLLAATFSSAINSFVGASRILHAMGEQEVLPQGRWFSFRSGAGIPRHAVLFTTLVVGLTLPLQDINVVAPLITLFFLITYGMVNGVILIEQNLGLVSFRPLLRIPRLIPLIGVIGALFAMFVINTLFSLIAIVLVVAFYYLLMYRHLNYATPYGDVRSSLFVGLAEWAAKKARNLPSSQERAWRPNLLIPVDSPAELRGVSEFVRDVVFPRGGVSILGVKSQNAEDTLTPGLPSIVSEFKDDRIFASWTVVDSESFDSGVIAAIQTLRSSFFKPTVLFLRMSQDPTRQEELADIIDGAVSSRMGILLYAEHRAGVGRRRRINLWITPSCQAWAPGQTLPNCDLAILISYKLLINWGARLTLIAAVEEEERLEEVRKNLSSLLEYARIPASDIRVVHGSEEEQVTLAEHADLNVFSLPARDRIRWVETMVRKARSTCIFCQDSTLENALV
jgi:solute carrier family 12 sodium/potassium/chloride transporter 2